MKVREIMDSKGWRVVTIGAQATLREALCTLVENKVGALPVQDGFGAVQGIITERDLMREVYKKSPLEQTRVDRVMTRNLITATPEDDIEYVMKEMTERRFRHMPVMVDGALAGIISIGDIVKAQLNHAKTQITHLIDYVAGPVAG